MKRINVTDKPKKRINVTDKAKRKIDPEELAKTLGAVPVSEEVKAKIIANYLAGQGRTCPFPRVPGAVYLNDIVRDLFPVQPMPDGAAPIFYSDLLKKEIVTSHPLCVRCYQPLRFLPREEEDKILWEELSKWVGFRTLKPDEQKAAVEKVRPLRFGFGPVPYFFCRKHGNLLPEEVVFPRTPDAVVVIENVAVPFDLQRFVPPNIDEALEYYPSFYKFSKTKMSVQEYLCRLLKEIDKAKIEDTNGERAFADYVHWLGSIVVLGEKIQRLAAAVGDLGPQVIPAIPVKKPDFQVREGPGVVAFNTLGVRPKPMTPAEAKKSNQMHKRIAKGLKKVAEKKACRRPPKPGRSKT